MKIGIIGAGTVGKATARTYLEFVDEIRVYDVVTTKRTHRWDDVIECDIIFICTPEINIEELFTEYAWGTERRKTANIVLKSTVPIGTTRKLREKYNLTNLVHSPEFLTARCAEVDARIPAVNIIGVPRWDDVAACEDEPCAYHLGLLYQRRFPGTQLLWMDSNESEAVKLMLNSAFAVKVSLFNEFYQYCKAANLDWETVRQGILADGRITTHHTKVPGPDGKYGFGGACLPKDLKQLEKCISEADCDTWMLQAAMSRNFQDRGE